MHRSIGILIATVAATALFGIAASTASAGRLEIVNPAEGFFINWAALRLEAAGRNVECNVKLKGVFTKQTFTKTPGLEIARVTEAEVPACRRGAAMALRETLPWNVSYQSFGGTLPRITEVTVNLIGAAFRVNIEGIECLARTTAARPARGIATIEGGVVVGFRAEPGARIETSGSFFCAIGGPASFSGAAETITTNGAVKRAITIALI